jgi:hypothetical protein
MRSLIVFLLMICVVPLWAHQFEKGQIGSGTVEPESDHPELRVEYQSVGKLKIASRKSTYHLGETIVIDAAILNLSKDRVCFLSSFEPELSISDNMGHKSSFVPYSIMERTVNTSSFAILDTQTFVTESLELLMGCDERAFGVPSDDAGAFDKGAFVTWGSGCLDVRRAGTYFLEGDVSNQNVLVSPDKVMRTAVGRIHSNKLKIAVVD